MRETAQTLQNRLDSSQKVEAFGNGFLQGSGLAHFAAQNFSARKGKLYIGRSGFAYKVGFSANPSARAKELGLSIIVAVPARMADELGLHQILDRNRFWPDRAEWYKQNKKLDSLIEVLLKEQKLPDEVIALGNCYEALLLAKREMRAAAAGFRSRFGGYDRRKTKRERENGGENHPVSD